MPETMKRDSGPYSPEIVDHKSLDQADQIRESRQGGDLSDRGAELADIAGDIEPTVKEQAERKKLDKEAPLREWINKTFGHGGLK
ncbi:MAG: hypothetical protein WC473_01260 [Patescibacteria group bacterium]|jgi:hypothetical protein